jgi:hypothetical protein
VFVSPQAFADERGFVILAQRPGFAMLRDALIEIADRSATRDRAHRSIGRIFGETSR